MKITKWTFCGSTFVPLFQKELCWKIVAWHFRKNPTGRQKLKTENPLKAFFSLRQQKKVWICFFHFFSFDSFRNFFWRKTFFPSRDFHRPWWCDDFCSRVSLSTLVLILWGGLVYFDEPCGSLVVISEIAWSVGPGFISCRLQNFSREPATLKFVWCTQALGKRMEGKN